MDHHLELIGGCVFEDPHVAWTSEYAGADPHMAVQLFGRAQRSEEEHVLAPATLSFQLHISRHLQHAVLPVQALSLEPMLEADLPVVALGVVVQLGVAARNGAFCYQTVLGEVAPEAEAFAVEVDQPALGWDPQLERP